MLPQAHKGLQSTAVTSTSLSFYFYSYFFSFFFFFFYFTIIKFLEFLPIYIVSWTELYVYFLNMFLFSNYFQGWLSCGQTWSSCSTFGTP